MPAASPQSSLFASRSGFAIRFPENRNDLDQDEEWFEFELNGRKRKLRIHDYAGLYSVPGLYEALIYDKLACKSPQRLTKLLAAVLMDWRTDARDLRVLDLGAGNGIVGEELGKLGVRHIVGLDLLEEAESAADRDRPGLYADYLVTDLSSPNQSDLSRLERHHINCLVTVAALGFGDIPPESFRTAFNAIAPGGWLGMTIKDEFLDSGDKSGFAGFVKALIDQDVIKIQAHQRYCHRLSISGEKLYYVAVVARKMRDIPGSFLSDDDASQDSTIIDNDKSTGHSSMLLGSSS